jgi:hypothetical protein
MRLGLSSVLFIGLLSPLSVGCEKPPSSTPWVVIGTFDYRQVSESQIISVLKEAGIEGRVSGEGGRVETFLVPADKARTAIEVLQKSKLPGLHLHEVGSLTK